MLEDERKGMLDAFCQEGEPSAADLDQSWSGLAGRVRAGDVGMDLPDTTATVPTWKLPLLVVGCGAGAAGVLLGVWLGTGDGAPALDVARVALVEPEAQVAPGQVEVAAEAKPVPAAEPVPEPMPAAKPESEPVPDAEPEAAAPGSSSARSRERSKRRAQAPPPADTDEAGVAEEMVLMTKARRALRAKSWQKALSLLSRHEREYPDGLFREERMASRVLALCALGREQEAKSHIEALQRTLPGSASARRLAKGCPAGGEPAGKREP